MLDTVGSAIDTMIGVVAPQWAARRSAARMQSRLQQRQAEIIEGRLERLSHWGGAETNRVRGDLWLASDLSTDAALEEELPKLQRRCEGLYRSNGIAHSAIEGRVANEVGIGLNPQSMIDPADGLSEEDVSLIGREIEAQIGRWSSTGADRSRKQSLAQVQKIVQRSFAASGEAFVEFGIGQNGDLALAVIPPVQIETPPQHLMDPLYRMGVEYDQDGEVAAYHVRDSHPGDNKEFEYSWTRIPRRNPDGSDRMVHVFDPLFPQQSRGIPWLAAAMNRMLDLDTFFEAELVAKQIEACFGLAIHTSGEGSSPADIASGQVTTEAHSSNRSISEIRPGMLQWLEEGDEIKTLDPQRPGNNFVPFVERSLRMIAGACNYPYELLAKDFFRTTYSSGRLAVMDGRMGFLMRRQVMVEQFLQPLYRRLIHELVLSGRVSISARVYRRDPAPWTKHWWKAQGAGYIDPAKEVKANREAKDAGITNDATIYGEQGQDWEDAYRQRHRELMRQAEYDAKLEARRQELAKEYGVDPGTLRAEQRPLDTPPESDNDQDESEESGDDED